MQPPRKKQTSYLVWAGMLTLLLAALFAMYAFVAYFPGKTVPEAYAPIIANPFDGQEVVSEGIIAPKPPEITLIAVGDNMLSRDVARKIQTHGVDYPYTKMRDYLTSADLTFGNLETPITSGPSVPMSSMTFHSDPKVVAGLKDAGFDILSLANNHTPNYGQKGLLDTFRYLSDGGIQYVGAGENSAEAEAPTFVTSKGIKIAFLAYNDTDVVPDSYGAGANRAGTNIMDTKKIATAVVEAKKQADLVIASMHSGVEYTATPNASQKNFAHAAVDAGADLIIGHHPHVVQTLEKYHDKFIIYSLGNFVFDQMWSRETRQGMTAKIFLAQKGVEKIEFHPVLIYDYAQPRLLDGTEKDTVLARLGYPLEEGVAK